jgi:hypothetical protein
MKTVNLKVMGGGGTETLAVFLSAMSERPSKQHCYDMGFGVRENAHHSSPSPDLDQWIRRESRAAGLRRPGKIVQFPISQPSRLRQHRVRKSQGNRQR